MKSAITNLTAEVAELRAALKSETHSCAGDQVQTSQDAPQARMWNEVVRRGRQQMSKNNREGRRTQRGGEKQHASSDPRDNRKHGTISRAGAPPSSMTLASESAESGSKPNRDRTAAKLKVEGARIIWNTWIYTTTKSVETAIANFCGSMEGLRVRRKTRISERSGKTLWWFVVHGEESKLCDLESMWERVSVQTSWEIRSCFAPAPDTQNNNAISTTPTPTTEPQAESQLLAANVVAPTGVQASQDKASTSASQSQNTSATPFLGHTSLHQSQNPWRIHSIIFLNSLL